MDRLYKSTRVQLSRGSSNSPAKYPNTVKINNYFSSSLRDSKPAPNPQAKLLIDKQNPKPQWKGSDSKRGAKLRSVSRSTEKIPPKKASTVRSDKVEIDSIVERLSRVKIEKPIEKPPIAKPTPEITKKSVSPPKERKAPIVAPTPKPELPKIEKATPKPAPKQIEKPKSPPIPKKHEIIVKKEPEPVKDQSTSFIELPDLESEKDEEKDTHVTPTLKPIETEVEEPITTETVKEDEPESVIEVVTKPTRIAPQGSDDPLTVHLIKPSEGRPLSIPVVVGALHSNKNEFQEVYPLNIFITPVVRF